LRIAILGAVFTMFAGGVGEESHIFGGLRPPKSAAASAR
jgi:hypothetical protein